MLSRARTLGGGDGKGIEGKKEAEILSSFAEPLKTVGELGVGSSGAPVGCPALLPAKGCQSPVGLGFIFRGRIFKFPGLHCFYTEGSWALNLAAFVIDSVS